MKIKENKKRDNYRDMARGQKIVENGNSDTNCGWSTWDNLQRIGTGITKLGNKKTSRDHPDKSILRSARMPRRVPGDLKRLAVTQTQVKNHLLSWCEKISE